MISGIGILIFIDPSNILNTMIDASTKTVNLCISLIAIYAVWLGLLKILEDRVKNITFEIHFLRVLLLILLLFFVLFLMQS